MPTMQNGTITAIKLNDTTKPSNPPSGENKIYFKSGVMYKVDSAGTESAFTTATPALNDYIYLRDEKTQNTNGGTFTSGAWQTRTINAEVSDTAGHATLASNQITLAAGTYICKISAPAYGVNRNQARLQNITDTATTLLGTNEYSNATNGTSTRSFIAGKFTIAAPKVFEVQHRCETTQANIGYGVLCNFTTEIYTIVEFWKIA